MVSYINYNSFFNCSNVCLAGVKTCLQTITYLSYFEEIGHRHIFLQGGERGTLIDIESKSGRAHLFWAVFARGNSCFKIQENESFNIGEVKIQEHWKKTCRRLLEYLLDETEEYELHDRTPIINLILLSGKVYELQNDVRNLFDNFINQIDLGQRSNSHIRQRCPYSDETSIDVAIRMESKIDELKKLDYHGAAPNHKTLTFWTTLKTAKSRDIHHNIPDPPVKEDPYNATKYLHKAIHKLLKDEDDFTSEIDKHFVSKWKIGQPHVEEAEITENVFIWVNKALRAIENINPGLQQVLKLSLSGSIAEGCRLKTRKPDIEPDPEKVIFFQLILSKLLPLFVREYLKLMNMK